MDKGIRGSCIGLGIPASSVYTHVVLGYHPSAQHQAELEHLPIATLAAYFTSPSSDTPVAI